MKMTPTEAGRCDIAKTLIRVKLQKQERVDKYNLNPNKCFECKTILPYESRHHKFCNNICSANCYNKTRVGNKPKKYCLGCTKEILSGKYCTIQCQADYEFKIACQKIDNGERVGVRTIKRYLVFTRGHKCEICGLTEWLNKPILLIMDHKDGNSEDNSVSNLRLVCSNCDATLPTYKSRNKHPGRQYRRSRYAQGKTF